MVRVSDWSVQMSGVGAGTANLSLCVAYSPNGQDIVTGGDDSSLTVWSAQNGQVRIAYIPPGMFWSLWSIQRTRFWVGNIPNIFNTRKDITF